MSNHSFLMPIDRMTDKEIEGEIKLRREQILSGNVGTPNVYVRLADLERVLEERGLHTMAQGWQITITIYDPHMKKIESEAVSYICSTTAEKRLKQASDALMDRNWLVMNDENIKSSFEEITESAFSPTPEDIGEIHDILERAIDAGGILDHVKEVRDIVIQNYIEKHYVEKMDALRLRVLPQPQQEMR